MNGKRRLLIIIGAILGVGVLIAHLAAGGWLLFGNRQDGEIDETLNLLHNASFEEVDGEKRVSDVTLECSLTAENLTNNIPLQFAFYEDAGRTKPLDTVTLTPGQESSQAFYLVISWPSNYNDGSYAFEIDAVRIIATATQVD